MQKFRIKTMHYIGVCLFRVKEIFSLDLRSLALFRASFALLLLSDLVVRAQALLAHYSDLGVLPRELAAQYYRQPFFFSPHFLSGSPEAQAALFIIAAVCALLLLVGYKTRLATIVSWFLLISLQRRNPLVLQGGDILMRVALFWAMFLPWGKRYSVDGVRARARHTRNWYSSPWSAAFVLQIAFVYLFAGFLKNGVEWTREGSAIYYALSTDQFTKPFGYLLLQFPDLLRLLTLATLHFERFAPLLFFSPIFTRGLRLVAIAGFMVMHVGFMMSMHLGVFPWIGISTMLALLPSSFWNCAWCGGAVGRVHHALRLRTPPRARALLWSLKARVNTFIAARQRRKSHLSFVHAKAPAPLHIRLWRQGAGAFGTALALSLIVLVLLWNIAELPRPPFEMPPVLRDIARTLYIGQRWAMFAEPTREDGWYAILGTRADGSILDLFRDGATPSFEKPRSVATLYKTDRWRKYFMNLYQERHTDYRQYYAAYLCRAWNNSLNEAERVVKIDIIFMSEITLPRRESPPEKKLLGTYACAAQAPTP